MMSLFSTELKKILVGETEPNGRHLKRLLVLIFNFMLVSFDKKRGGGKYYKTFPSENENSVLISYLLKSGHA